MTSNKKTQKSFAFVLAILSLLVLSVSFAAALSLSAPETLTKANNQTTLNLLNDFGSAQDVSISVSNIIEDSNQVVLSVSPTSIINMAASAQEPLTVSISNVLGDDFSFGTHTSTLTATGTNNSDTQTITYLQSFCENGEVSSPDFELELKNVDISSTGDEDEEWKPMDEITIDIDVENVGDEDLSDILVEMAVYDSSGDNVAGDLDFISADEDQVDLGRLNNDDEDTVTFQFVVPADFDEGSYKLAFKVYSDDEGEDVVCADTSGDLNKDYYQDIDVIKEDDEGKFIAFTDTEIKPTKATCGDSVTLDTDVFNIGEEDQDQVKVNLVISGLNVDLPREIKSGLDIGDDQVVSFTFTVPSTVKDGTYTIELDSEYDYRKGVYRQKSDESLEIPFTVFGCSVSTGTGTTGTTTKAVGITATLESDAKAGTELIVRANLQNLGTESQTVIVSASDYENWASLNSISNRIVEIAPGASKDVIISFNTNDDAAGQKSFTIEAITGDKVDSREVSVTIEEKASVFSGFSLGGNALIWIIGIINVILIVLIIIVAVKISRR